MGAGPGQTSPSERTTSRDSDKWSRRVMVFPDRIGNSCGMQAEELDNLVQHLAVAKYALEADDKLRASEALDAAMAIARRLLTRQQAENGPAGAESMVRTRPSP